MHFKVFVIHSEDQNVQDLMAPFDENIDVEPYIDMTAEELAKKASAAADTIEHYAQARGYELDAQGNAISTYNPNSKWDYYRYYERFEVDDTYEAEALIKDIEFADETLANGAGEWWDKYIEGEETVYNQKYFKKMYGSKENYVRARGFEYPYACVTPDGKWNAPGEIGWFASSESDEEYENWCMHFKEHFIDPYDPETTYVTSLDCHI